MKTTFTLALVNESETDGQNTAAFKFPIPPALEQLHDKHLLPLGLTVYLQDHHKDDNDNLFSEIDHVVVNAHTGDVEYILAPVILDSKKAFNTYSSFLNEVFGADVDDEQSFSAEEIEHMNGIYLK